MMSALVNSTPALQRLPEQLLVLPTDPRLIPEQLLVLPTDPRAH